MNNLRRAVAEAFHPGEIITATLAGSQSINRYLNKPAVRNASATFSSIGTLVANGSAATPIFAIKHADDVGDLTHAARISRSLGAKSDAVMVVMKRRLYKMFPILQDVVATAPRPRRLGSLVDTRHDGTALCLPTSGRGSQPGVADYHLTSFCGAGTSAVWN